MSKPRQVSIRITSLMMIFTAVLLFVAVSVLAAAPARAASIEVDIQVEESFTVDEEMIFYYSILSDIQTDISYVAGIDCPVHPIPPLELTNLSAGENAPIQTSFSLGIVEASAVSQECEARVTIIEPELQEVVETFTIEMDPVTMITIKTCRDEACDLPAKIFHEGDTVYLDYESDPSLEDGDTVSVNIQTPSDDETTVSVPGKYIPSSTGTYTIQIEFDSDSYRSSKSEYYFAVNESAVSLESLVEDGDSVDAASLPDDVPEPDDQSLLSSVLDWIEANVRIFAAGILAISVILLVVFIIWIRKTSPK